MERGFIYIYKHVKEVITEEMLCVACGLAVFGAYHRPSTFPLFGL